jgi:hypothetical protein
MKPIPAISDAFKVPETLFLMMRGMQKKETIKYSIFFPLLLHLRLQRKSGV